jgi:hypothetical protein
MGELRLVPAVRDLPPAWDGHRVEWRGWSTGTTTASLHEEPDPCSVCKSRAEPAISLGLIYPLYGETTDVPREKRLRSGRTYLRTIAVAAWPLLQLAAFRCPDCSHDVVWDKRDDTWWDLDLSDYGDSGSVPPPPKLWELTWADLEPLDAFLRRQPGRCHVCGGHVLTQGHAPSCRKDGTRPNGGPGSASVR